MSPASVSSKFDGHTSTPSNGVKQRDTDRELSDHRTERSAPTLRVTANGNISRTFARSAPPIAAWADSATTVTIAASLEIMTMLRVCPPFIPEPQPSS